MRKNGHRTTYSVHFHHYLTLTDCEETRCAARYTILYYATAGGSSLYSMEIVQKTKENDKINDINIISFNLIDKESGVNDQKIEINLNGKKLYYDYIKYRDLIAARVKNELIIGENHLSIKCLDNLGNISQIEGHFTIE